MKSLAFFAWGAEFAPVQKHMALQRPHFFIHLTFEITHSLLLIYSSRSYQSVAFHPLKLHP